MEEIVKTLYESAEYRVIEFYGEADAPYIVTFDNWTPEPRFDAPSFAEGFLRKYRMSYACIKTSRNDWYQGDIEPALNAAKSAIKGRRCFTYGSSMGAYAAVNFADDLGAERAIAFAPQFSIDPSKVPFEKRWRTEAAAVDFRNDRTHKPSNSICVTVYDPNEEKDVAHIELISRMRPVERIELPYAGHAIGDALSHCGLLSTFTLALINGTLDVADFHRRFMEARAVSA